MNTVVQIVRSMRPAQWVKNLLVAAPVLFAKKRTVEDPAILAKAALATAVFVLLAGAVYVMNDVLDVEKDREHPVRRLRPIASGAVSIQTAVAGGLCALGLAYAAGWFLGAPFTLVATIYLLQNVFYSSVFKRIAYLDVLSIATGFLLRIVSGCFAIGLEPAEISYYLIVCTFLVALFFALGKRRHELAMLGGDAGSHRSVLSQYRLHHLDLAMYLVGLVTLAAYCLYTVSGRTLDYFGNLRLVFTVPFVLFGMWRFLAIARREGERRSPTDAMVRDPLFVVDSVVWVAVAAWAVYG